MHMKSRTVINIAIIRLFLLTVLILTLPAISFAGGPDGTVNNFINQNPFAFSMHKPNTFVSFNALQYQGFNQVYNNNGELISKPAQQQILFIPAFVWTYRFLRKVNFFEVAFPVGSQKLYIKHIPQIYFI